MKYASYTVISAPEKLDSFMKAADLFNGKNLGYIKNMTIEYKDSTNMSLERAALAMSPLREALEENGHIVSFIHLKEIRDGDNITLNSKIKPIVDMKAREISDGEKAFVFKYFIERYTAFKCKTDENYCITEII